MTYRLGILTFAMVTAIPAFAQQAQPAEPQDNSAIVVTGTPLADSAKRLKDCLARHCPPNEDIDASLAYAENQFIAGDYQAGRETLAASHNRNRRFASTYPTEVADLSRAYGRLTNLSGYPEQGRLLQIDSLAALKAGLTSDDARVLAQRLETGDEYVKQGRVDAGEEVYRQVEKQARKAGQYNILSAAMLRPAMVYLALSKINAGYEGDARARIRRVEETREPELKEARAAAKILSARLAGQGNDMAAFEKAVSGLDNERTDRAVLLYSPAMDTEVPAGYRTGNYNAAPQWMDVRYRVDLDGRVQDVEVLRTSENAEGYWKNIALSSIARRRYMPLDLAGKANGLVRVERFSFVRDATDRTGSRMAERTNAGRISSMDITIEPSARPATDKGR
jgi:hypothetical protein